MDIAIPLAKCRYNNYYELRITLRSIEKNLTGYRNIYIIGEKPGWLTNVIHVPIPDMAGKKVFSIFRKMMTAAKMEGVSENFISWSDDTPLLEPLAATDIKDWYDNTLEYWSHLNINTMYRNIIKNTWKVFPDGLFFNVHTPCIYNKERFRGLNKYNWMSTGLLIKSTYFNSGESNPVHMKEPKRHPGLFISTGRKITDEENKLFRDMFYKPSKYEADNNANAKAALSLAKTTG